MIYRVVASMLFVDRDEAVDFFHDCEVALPKASVIHPCQDNQEFSMTELQECHHDETPSAPCTSLDEVDNAPVCST